MRKAIRLFAAFLVASAMVIGFSPSTALAATPASIIKKIEKDFSKTEKKLTDDLEKTKQTVGTSFDEYQANKQSIDTWYREVEDESSRLFDRTQKNGRKYYELLGKSAAKTKRSKFDKQMKNFYRKVYDKAHKGFYRSIYEDAYKDLYRTYYDGSTFKDAYDTNDYNTVSDAQSECYQNYSDSLGTVYQEYSDSLSAVYQDYSEVWSAYYDHDFDFAKIWVE